MPKPTIADLQKAFLSLAEKFTELGGAIAETRAAINVLKSVVAVQLSPDNPEAALKLLQTLETRLLETDANEQERRAVQEQIGALRAWRETGRTTVDS